MCANHSLNLFQSNNNTICTEEDHQLEVEDVVEDAVEDAEDLVEGKNLGKNEYIQFGCIRCIYVILCQPHPSFLFWFS